MSRFTHLSRQDEPPEVGFVIPLKRILASSHFTATILSHGWNGYNTHFMGKRTIVHNQDPLQCEGCLALRRIKWSCYIHVLCDGYPRGCVIELTDVSVKQLKAIKGDRPSLRGFQIYLTRQNGMKHGPVEIALVSIHQDTSDLLRAQDVRPTLKRLWNLEHLD